MNLPNQIADQFPDGGYHEPVMLSEALEALCIRPDGVYVDCTFGGGGHSKAILKNLGSEGRLIAFDQDEDAAANLPDDPRIIFVPHNFRHLQRFLKLHKYPQVDGILADLGVSSHQFDEASRGFSYRFDAALDMRMNQRTGTTAAEILETYGRERLQNMFGQLGEVTNARTLAEVIVQQQGTGRLKTINGFRDVISGVVKGNPNKYLSKAFQALRMEVNDEMGALQELLEQLPQALKHGGRVAIITFHSLEDRMVKNYFRSGAAEESDLYGTKPAHPLTVITKKPIVPSAEEVRRNPRSRSAKLRVAEKTST